MFLSIKNIPKVNWSSKKPLNLKPRLSTFFYLCIGLLTLELFIYSYYYLHRYKNYPKFGWGKFKEIEDELLKESEI